MSGCYCLFNLDAERGRLNGHVKYPRFKYMSMIRAEVNFKITADLVNYLYVTLDDMHFMDDEISCTGY